MKLSKFIDEIQLQQRNVEEIHHHWEKIELEIKWKCKAILLNGLSFARYCIHLFKLLQAKAARGNDADLTEKLNHTYINRRIAQFNKEDVVGFVIEMINQ